MRFTGCGTALVTPFQLDFSLDEAALRKLVQRQLNAGVDFLVPCGTTGENPTLKRREHLRVVEITLEESAGEIPVLAGAGGYNTQEVAELARELESLGANGLLSVTPYYNKPTQEGLYQHYREIARCTRLPIVLYNVPGRCGTNLESATVKRLAAIENVVGIKEASGNISQLRLHRAYPGLSSPSPSTPHGCWDQPAVKLCTAPSLPAGARSSTIDLRSSAGC